ncbi:hypothetical protein QFZ20_001845 [Flavobacterium sp. W4I14]|nr:hypothetical protein [Flavobacterium sp. W4I14]
MPLDIALKALILALRDSAEAFVDLLIKKVKDMQIMRSVMILFRLSAFPNTPQ